MKKNIKLEMLFIALSCFLCSKVALADVESAVKALDSNITPSIQTTAAALTDINETITEVYKESFIGSEGQVSALDAKIAAYVNSFYGMFVPRPTAISKALKGRLKDTTWKRAVDINLNKLSSELYRLDKYVDRDIRAGMSKYIGYNFKRDPADKKYDDILLLMKRVESGANNVGTNAEGKKVAIVNSPQFKISDKKRLAKLSSLGPLSNSAPIETSMPTIRDLIGPDAYKNKAEEERAKLFIRYALDMVPPMKSFDMPYKEKNASIKLPKKIDGKDDVPIGSEEVEVSTALLESGLDKYNSGDSDKKYNSYDAMLDFVQNSKYYQKYKAKLRSSEILRTVFLDSFMTAYQERVPKGVKNISRVGRGVSGIMGGKSLVQKEKEAVMGGLDKSYYNQLREKTMAEVNLEMLYAINRLNYTLNKIHEDNVRSNMINSILALKMVGDGSMDEREYLNPLLVQIKNKCWTKAGAEKNEAACKNPADPRFAVQVTE